MTNGIRKTARWSEDVPMTEKTQNELIWELEAKYGKDKVRRVVLVCPVAVEKVIDNEEDAKTTIANLQKHREGG